MKKQLVMALTILFLLTVILQSAALAERKWTIMVYGCADNNLDPAGVNDLNELELSGSDSNMNIIFLLDRWGMNDTHLYYVEHDTLGLPGGDDNNIISTLIDDSAPWLAPEEDMGNPQTLMDFLLWTTANYPAEHYLISIWDHGSGIFKEDEPFITKGECWDDYGGIPNDYIDLKELKTVMSAVYSQLGRKVDILGHDVCLAGQFETHYQVRDYADISIASADNEPMEGWDYEGPFVNLKANPDMSPEELAHQIVEYYYNWYGPGPSCCNTQAAVDLRLMKTEFMPAFHDFNQTLIQYCNQYLSEITAYRNMSAYYQTPNYDLWNFADYLAADETLPQELRDAASDLAVSLDQTFINHHTADYTDGYGCTIWFPTNYPTNSDVGDYKTKIDFNNTSWSHFLRIFAGEMIIFTDNLSEGYLDQPYHQEFTAVNGIPPYHWEKASGQFPYGLLLTDGDTAVLSGTPTYAASYGFTLKVTDSSVPAKEDTRPFQVIIRQHPYHNGDANYDGAITIADAVYLINYIFLGGDPPDPYLLGDANCDGMVKLVDVIYIINYIFRSGPAPCQSFDD
jgi:hypothetical protein